MTALAGLDVSGADVNILSAAIEAQPLRPKLFVVKNASTMDVDDDAVSTSNATQFLNSVGQGRELWRTHDVPDPAVIRQEDTVLAELGAIVLRARHLVTQDPDSPMAGARLATALMNAGQVDEASQIATRLSTTQVEDIPAAIVITHVLLQAGHRDNADSFAMRMSHTGTSEAAPIADSAAIFRCLAAALAAERGDHELALLRLEDVATVQAHALRGYLLLEVEQPQRALHELRIARKSTRTQVPALLSNVAYAHAVLGAQGKAISAARQALASSPGNHLVLKHLSGYLIAAGRPEEAISILKQAAGQHGDLPPDLATVLAGAFFQAGDPGRSLRTLHEAAQRARFNKADPIVRAELQAYAALLEFNRRRINRRQWIETIRKQQQVADGRSILIGCMLADALANRAHRAEVLEAYERLRAIYSEKQLLPLRARLASMAGDINEQLRLVRAWARAMPLDIDALTSEVYLLCEFQNYEAAASAGLNALRRFPHAVMLRNNTAYALAMTGDARRASQVLKPIMRANAYAVATAGLIQLRKGQIRDGIMLYQEAAEIAHSEGGDADQAALQVAQLALHLRLVVMELGLDSEPSVRENLLRVPDLNRVWFDEPIFMALAWRAKRLSLPWPPTSQG